MLSAPDFGDGEDGGGLSQNDGDEPLEQVELDVGDICLGREVSDLGFDYCYSLVNRGNPVSTVDNLVWTVLRPVSTVANPVSTVARRSSICSNVVINFSEIG